MADFDGLDDVERDLGRLADREEPLVQRRERQPGQKEARYLTTLVHGESRGSGHAAPAPARTTTPPGPVERTRRIGPLTEDELDDEKRELLAGVTLVGGTINIFRTLVRHPGLFRKWMPFGGKLLAGKLGARDRELAILRTGWHVRSEYEWGQHVGIAKRVGVTDEEITRVVQGPDAPGWTVAEAAVLRAADELHHDSCVSDTTWSTLTDHFDEKQLIELVMVVGHYHMVGFALNTLGVEREEGVPGFPS
jgi:alkylhydroperoxidase family enzyme